jgi:hypothetical protein
MSLQIAFAAKIDLADGPAFKLCLTTNAVSVELHNLLPSPNIITRSSRGERGGRDMWPALEERKLYKVLVGKPEGKSPLGRSRRKWKDGIRMDLREMGWGCGLDPTGSG